MCTRVDKYRVMHLEHQIFTKYSIFAQKLPILALLMNASMLDFECDKVNLIENHQKHANFYIGVSKLIILDHS